MDLRLKCRNNCWLNQHKMKKKPKKSVKRKEPVDEELKKRSDFENNQDIIGAAFFKLISTNGKIPTLSKLAAATNLSTKTIDRHLKAESFKEMKGKLRAFNDMMLVQFAQKVSKSSNPGMWDMYWLLTEDEYAKTKNKSNVAVTVTGKLPSWLEKK